MQGLDRALTDKEKEKAWIREFFKVKFNATETTRRVYGGTPGSCRVKGHKRLKKLEPILREIHEREFHKMEYQRINGIEFYLADLERRFHKEEKYDEILKMALKSKGGFAQLEKAIREVKGR